MKLVAMVVLLLVAASPLRLQRFASGLGFFQSVAFAVSSVALVSLVSPSAASIVLAYGAACLFSTVLALAWGWRFELGGGQKDLVRL